MAKMQFRRDTALAWSQHDPVLLDGEIGIEKDSHRFKLGDGLKKWSLLPYSSASLADNAVRFIEGLPLTNVEYAQNGAVHTLVYGGVYTVVFTYNADALVSKIDYLDTDNTTVLKTVTLTYNADKQLVSHS